MSDDSNDIGRYETGGRDHDRGGRRGARGSTRRPTHDRTADESQSHSETNHRGSRGGGQRYVTHRPSRNEGEAGTPNEGSQRGSHRGQGIAGRMGGQRGDHHAHGTSGRGNEDPHDVSRGARQCGGDERVRRYGSRRGHGSQRRDDRRHR